MANTHSNLTDLFTGIANAIRVKKNSTDVIVADAFPTEIENLRTGFDYNNQNVTSIPDYAFYSCEDLSSVDCYNLTSVGASAFENCTNLKSVVLYEGVESVGENAFKGCSESLTIYCYFDSKPETWHENWNPDGCEVVWLTPVETWDISATEDDDVVAKLYEDIQKEGYYSLVISGEGNMANYNLGDAERPWYSYDKNIIYINIFNSVTSIGNYAFYYCSSLTSVTIGNSVTSIGDYAFSSCESLASIVIPDSVTGIGWNAFSHCIGLTNITIPASVTSIGNSAFSRCSSLTSVTIPSSVTSIDNYAFKYCERLTSITIGNGVTSIGTDAFSMCKQLTSMTFNGTIAQWNAIEKNRNWNANVPATYVQCSDGQVAL